METISITDLQIGVAHITTTPLLIRSPESSVLTEFEKGHPPSFLKGEVFLPVYVLINKAPVEPIRIILRRNVLQVKRFHVQCFHVQRLSEQMFS